MDDHVLMLRSNVAAWNRFRTEAADVTGPDLRGANLAGAELAGVNLLGANLHRADLSGANLSGADLRRVNFRDANLTSAILDGAELYRANFNRAVLRHSSLVEANLYRGYLGRSDMTGVDLRRADLQRATLVDVNVEGARLTGAQVHGLSAWNLEGKPADQQDLVITPPEEPAVTVDSLKVAQFVYLLLDNPEIRDVIDTVSRKGVLILGRFSDERKPVLDALRDALRRHNLAPMMFDFLKPTTKGFGETVKVLAGMSRFVIADVTDSLEVRSELAQLVPGMPSLPVLPILLRGSRLYATFDTDVRPYSSVLPVHEYASADQLVAGINESIIAPVERWLSSRTAAPSSHLDASERQATLLERFHKQWQDGIITKHELETMKQKLFQI